MSAGGIGQLYTQRRQRQRLAASVVRHDETVCCYEDMDIGRNQWLGGVYVQAVRL